MDTVSRTDVEITKRSLGSNYYLKVKNLSHGFIYDIMSSSATTQIILMPETLEKMKKAFPCIRNLIDNGFYTFLFEIDSFLTAKVKEVMRRIVIEFCQEHKARNSATIIVIFFYH